VSILGLGAGTAQTRLSDTIRGGGFNNYTSELAAASLVNSVLGHVSHEQQHIQVDSPGAVPGENPADPANAATASRRREASICYSADSASSSHPNVVLLMPRRCGRRNVSVLLIHTGALARG
jgi:hypothetical protein